MLKTLDEFVQIAATELIFFHRGAYKGSFSMLGQKTEKRRCRIAMGIGLCALMISVASSPSWASGKHFTLISSPQGSNGLGLFRSIAQLFGAGRSATSSEAKEKHQVAATSPTSSVITSLRRVVHHGDGVSSVDGVVTYHPWSGTPTEPIDTAPLQLTLLPDIVLTQYDEQTGTTRPLTQQEIDALADQEILYWNDIHTTQQKLIKRKAVEKPVRRTHSQSEQVFQLYAKGTHATGSLQGNQQRRSYPWIEHRGEYTLHQWDTFSEGAKAASTAIGRFSGRLPSTQYNQHVDAVRRSEVNGSGYTLICGYFLKSKIGPISY